VIKFALHSLASRRLRSALTALAIVLGVAMVSGTYVLTDSINRAFHSIFTEVYRGTDATITGKAAFDVTQGTGSEVPSFSDSLLAKVRKLPQVNDAIGGVGGEAQIIGGNGKVVAFGGAPNLGFSVDPSRPAFNTLTLEEGKWPGDGEVVIDKSTASKKDFKIGQIVGIQAAGAVHRMRISGFVRFGGVNSLGGATLAGFNLPTAQALFDKKGQLDQIRATAAGGVPPQELVAAIRQILPPQTQVRTGSQQATEDAKDTNNFLNFLQNFLLAFGGIALFVGSFVIANSLSITIAQRTRELATLRTLGASRRQVLGAIVIEALTVGTLASVTGLFLGLALAVGLFRLFDAVGFTLPNSGLVLITRTVIVSLLAGILVTLVASLRPALRATRVPPIAAVREGATLPPSRFARFRTIGSIVITALGFAGLVWGLFGPNLSTTAILAWMGFGTLLVFSGVALFSARLVRPLAAGGSPVATAALLVLFLLAFPFFILPFWLQRLAFLGGASAPARLAAGLAGCVLNPILVPVVLAMKLRRRLRSWRPEWPAEFPVPNTGQEIAALARDNARRNPQRTASTSAALMIGLALVTLVAVLAAGITSSFKGAVNDLWHADYAITAQNNFSPIPTTAGDRAARIPGVTAVMNVRGGEVRAFGHTINATGVNPAAQKLIELKWKDGSQSVLAQLGADGALIDNGYAKDHHLTVGSPVELLFSGGDRSTFIVRGIFDPPTGGSPFGRVTISNQAWDARTDQPRNLYSFLTIRGGETDANQARLDKALKGFPNAKVQTRKEFIDNQISGLSSVLNILYVLLALSIVVSLFGIVNTLVLTVFERTREIGMLRAVGMTRLQVRRLIRHESVITALIGAVLGIVLGIVLGALLVERVDFIQFSLPVVSIVIFAVAAVLVGVIAAIFPARRASRLNPLEALQYE
jgi:putative ABC transport system permease protein